MKRSSSSVLVVATSLVATSLVATSLVAGVAAGTVAAQERVRVPSGVDEPLPDAARRIAEAIPDEGTEPPDQHYFRSNEWRQDLLRPHLEGLGGAYVGVGSDQNYTMAAMAGSEMLFLVDYDPFIPWVHDIYGVLVPPSESPEALIARFSEESEDETIALLRSELADHPRLTPLVHYFRRKRPAWHAYLERVSRLERDGRGFSWLADDDLYAHVRDLHRNGRIVSRNGDVTADGTLRAVGDAAKRLGLTVRIVYFSNAEQFFPYTDGFVENMKNLPTDERTVAVRTIRQRGIPIAEDGRWHFMVHDFPDFLERLESGVYRRSFALVADLRSAGPPFLGADGISTMTQETPRRMLDVARERRERRQRRQAAEVD